jgi:hypothetical protein
VQTQSENVVHQDKGALQRLQHENLRELVRRILVALQNEHVQKPILNFSCAHL